MDNLIFSLNATIPLFLVMVLGWALMQGHFFTKEFVSVSDKYVFKVALPALLFQDIAKLDFRTGFQPSFVLYCALMTCFMFFSAWIFAKKFVKEKESVGAFAQGAARGSAAVLGLALAQNIYGSTGMTPLMVLAAVPLFNIFSVLILTFSAPEDAGAETKARIKKALFNIVTNPIILGIVVGAPFALFQIQLPTILSKTISSVAATSTPIALLGIGAGFEGKKALSSLKYTLTATGFKLFLYPAIGLFFAVLLGFRESALIAVLIMTGSSTTPSSYVMAKNMGNDASLTSSIIVSSTLLSSLSLTVWIFLLRSMSLI